MRLQPKRSVGAALARRWRGVGAALARRAPAAFPNAGPLDAAKWPICATCAGCTSPLYSPCATDDVAEVVPRRRYCVHAPCWGGFTMLDRIFARAKGQGLVEYALIIALVAIVVIATLILLGPQIRSIFQNISNNL